MNRFRTYGELDENPKGDGDAFFIGVNERLAPWQLREGYVSSAKNKRFRKGRVETRAGIQMCRWMKTDGVTPFTEVYGSAEFFDGTDELRWLVIAADGGIWKTRPNTVATSVPLPAGVTITAETFAMFVQCDNTLILLRGPNADPLACRDLDIGFEEITQTTTGTGTDPIPRSSFGFYFANRLMLIVERDQVAVSDIRDYTRYVPIINTFRINQGDNDRLRAIAAIDESTLIFLKDRSVWKVTGIGGDLSTAVGPLLVTEQYGCAAPFSVVRVGRQLFWWSDQNSMVSLQLTELNEVQAQAKALTDDMPVTLARVNRQYISNIRGTYFDGFIYMAVPLDDADVLGAELVAAGSTYSTGGATTDPVTGESVQYYQLSVTAGATYRYAQANDAVDIYLANDTENYYGGMEFTAVNSYVRFYGVTGQPVGASLREVKAEGVCNGVMVFDTQAGEAGAWAGTDEAEPLVVSAWLTTPVLEQETLIYLGTDGWLHRYNYDFEDEVVRTVEDPYVEILIAASVAAGQTCQLNGGTVVTAANSGNTVGGNWDVRGATFSEILKFANALPSYKPTTIPNMEWTAPNTTKVPVGIAENGNPFPGSGCRFISTNGVVPTVNINGSPVTTSGAYGSGSWAWVQFYTGSVIETIDIEDEVVTRGYLCREADLKRYNRVKVGLRTWNPTYSLATLTDGVAEETAQLDDQTLSRTDYVRPAGRAAWQTDNENDDFLTPYRGDYSVVLPAAGMALGDEGVALDLHQEVMERLPVNQEGLYLQVRVTNTTGRCELAMVGLEAGDGPYRDGRII